MRQPTKAQLTRLEELKKTDPTLEVRWSEMGSVARLRGRFTEEEDGETVAIAQSFLASNKALFGITDPPREIVLANVNTDRQGNHHIRFQQMVSGVPVFGRQIIVHVDTQGVVTGTSGYFHPEPKVSAVPKQKPDAAIAIAARHEKGNKLWMNNPPLLTVLFRENAAYLCWQVTMEGTDKDLRGATVPAKWEYFIDAVTGEVIWRYNNLQWHSQTTGTGTGHYSGTVTINTVHNHTANAYELEDRWLPTTARLYTHDAGATGNPVSQDPDNNWSSAAQGAEVDCHYYTRQVYDYYLMNHGRNSYDDLGADLHSWAHYGTNINNAYWDGTRVKIGDGDGVTYASFSCLDILAHEWTHAVTENTAGLVYTGESGAINESMSDVFACLIEGNWLFGEDNWLGTTAPASRNLSDPTNGGQYDPNNAITSVLDGHQPDHTNDQYTGILDNGGVHINSGIANKVAYLIAVGGTHRSIRICEGLGNEVVGRIYYNALANHLTSGSQFQDLRDAIMDSLQDLYDGDPRYARWRTSVNNAFAAVGIGTALECGTVCRLSPQLLCPPQPHICFGQPHVICPLQPQMCSKQPQLLCPPQPAFKCPPQPTVCRIQPISGCSLGPSGCLPGPDPVPFEPEIREQVARASKVREEMTRPRAARKAGRKVNKSEKES